MAAIACFLVFAAPPYLTAYLKTGNPVYPFLNPATAPIDVRFKHALTLHTPYDLTFHTSQFMEGQDGVVWGQKTEAQRRQATIDCFVRYFGAEAASPLQYWEARWAAEKYSGGCYGTYLGPGTWTGFGIALDRPVGLVHWACSDISPRWNGYMDGAVRSGERAAKEVLAML